MLDILQLNDMLVPELRELAEQIGLTGYKRLNKQELIHRILDHQAVVGATGESEENSSESEEPAKKPRRARKARLREEDKRDKGDQNNNKKEDNT